MIISISIQILVFNNSSQIAIGVRIDKVMAYSNNNGKCVFPFRGILGCNYIVILMFQMEYCKFKILPTVLAGNCYDNLTYEMQLEGDNNIV